MMVVDNGIVIAQCDDDLVADLEGLSFVGRHLQRHLQRLKVADVDLHLIAADILDVPGDTPVSGKATVCRLARGLFPDRRTALLSLAVRPFLCGTKSVIGHDRRSAANH